MHKIKLLITGAHGMLGRSFVELTKNNDLYEVIALGKNELDVSDISKVLKYSNEISNGWIIHCAALVDVEGCARNPDMARKIIVEGTKNIIELAKLTNSRILYPQSFLTYGDCETDIPENFPQLPLHLYGELKLEAQKLIMDAIIDSIVIIMAGFFGGEEKDKNFVGKIIPQIWSAINEGKNEFAIGDRVWQPTWTNELARMSLKLINLNKSGVYQLSSFGEASFFELAEEIVKNLNWEDKIKIIPAPVAIATAGELGKRPNRAVLSCSRLRNEGIYDMKTWQETLGNYLSNKYFDKYRF